MPVDVTINVQKFLVLLLSLAGLGTFILCRLFLALDPQTDANNSTIERWESLRQSQKVPDEKLHHLSWFLQISDIHISKFYEFDRGPDLRKFCTQDIPIINPEVVLVTGDLTDAKLKDKQGSTQFEEEWKQYQNILQDSGVLGTTKWLDIRGNHDVFDVLSLDDRTNYYRKYSNKGRTDGETYKYVYTSEDGDKISFITVDACPNPGPKRPFNFFGLIKQEEMSKLREWAREAERHTNMTIWFGHYPTSTIGSPQPGIKELISHGAVYMSGHLHTLGNIVPKMYARYKTGNLELELGDWKDNRIFRLFAVDHGMFSFIDESLGTWPLVLVTNPKNGQFNMPRFEPSEMALKSTHIRILIFSPDAVQYVIVSIDGKEIGQAVHSHGPLYVLPWSTEKFSSGIHTMNVYVEDSNGRKRNVQQPVILDESQIGFSYFQNFVLLSDHSSNAKLCFVCAFCGLVIPLVILRFMKLTFEITNGRSVAGKCMQYLQRWIRRMYLLTKTDGVFFPLIFFHIYLALGPWFVGGLVQDHIGVCFVYGLYTNGTFIPGTLTYFYGVLQIIQFHLPLTLYYGYCLDFAICERKQGRQTSRHPVFSWLYNHCLFVFLILFQGYMAIHGFYLAYGGIAFLLCPIRTWSLFLAVYLRHKCLVISKCVNDCKGDNCSCTAFQKDSNTYTH